MDYGDEEPRPGSIRDETGTPGARAETGMDAEGHSALSGDEEHRRESEIAAAATATAAGGAPGVGDARNERSEFNNGTASAGMRTSEISPPWWGGDGEQERKVPTLPVVLAMARDAPWTVEQTEQMISNLIGLATRENETEASNLLLAAEFKNQPELVR